MNNPCDNCKKNEGKYQHCEGDGRLHGHGRVHIVSGGLQWLCDSCAEKAKLDWQMRKARQVISI